MYEVTKTMEVAGAHFLVLLYKSKCQNLHGHNWKISVTCQNETLNESGMVIDFTEIKRIVNQLDHENINHFVAQPTAENIAKWICDQIPHCVRVSVQESEGNMACYIK